MICKICSKNSKKHPLTNFFRFPQDPVRCALWSEKCNLEKEYRLLGPKYFNNSWRICSDHFNETYFYWDGKKTRPRNDAVPEYFLSQQVPVKPKVKMQVDSTTSNCRIEEVLAGLEEDDSEFRLEMVEHLCRLCGEERNNLTFIFGARGTDLKLYKKIKHIPIELCENDVMPTKICAECIRKVEEHYNFVSKCLEADEKLRIMLNMENCGSTYEALHLSWPTTKAAQQPSLRGMSACEETLLDGSLITPDVHFKIDYLNCGDSSREVPPSPIKVREVRPLGMGIKCPRCKTPLRRFSPLRSKMKKYLCDTCKKKFWSKRKLIDHIHQCPKISNGDTYHLNMTQMQLMPMEFVPCQASHGTT